MFNGSLWNQIQTSFCTCLLLSDENWWKMNMQENSLIHLINLVKVALGRKKFGDPCSRGMYDSNKHLSIFGATETEGRNWILRCGAAPEICSDITQAYEVILKSALFTWLACVLMAEFRGTQAAPTYRTFWLCSGLRSGQPAKSIHNIGEPNDAIATLLWQTWSLKCWLYTSVNLFQGMDPGENMDLIWLDLFAFILFYLFLFRPILFNFNFNFLSNFTTSYI